VKWEKAYSLEDLQDIIVHPVLFEIHGDIGDDIVDDCAVDSGLYARVVQDNGKV
jgi:hypothetical protein